MVNYGNSKIYKLCSDKTDKIYIGSTCYKYLSKRFSNHKWDENRYKQGKRKYQLTSSQLLCYDDCRIEIIEVFPCSCKEELHKRERYYIEKYKSQCVNKFIPTRTHAEYYIDNKQRLNQINKNNYEKNKETIKAQKSQVCTCECGLTYTRTHKARHKKTKKHINLMAKIKM